MAIRCRWRWDRLPSLSGSCSGAPIKRWWSCWLTNKKSSLGSQRAAAWSSSNRVDTFWWLPPRWWGVPYDMQVRLQRNRTPAPPVGQVVLLDFGGGQDLDLLVPTGRLAVRLESLPPFDLAGINPDLSGSEELVKSIVRQAVESIYADYAVTVVTDRQAAEQMGLFTTVVLTSALPGDVLGNLNLSTAGIEPRLDFENADPQGVGLLFAGLQTFRSTSLEGAARLAVQLGLVAAHEVGHALGLMHVVESSAGLMRPVVAVDAATSGESLPLLVRARLAETRIGIQDGPAYLRRVIGLRDPTEAEAIRRAGLELRPPAGKVRCWRCGW